LSLEAVFTRCLGLEARFLLFVETDVEAHVQGFHDVLRTRVQQDTRSVLRAHSNKTDAIPRNESDIYTNIYYLLKSTPIRNVT